jgi:hypothetical protein
MESKEIFQNSELFVTKGTVKEEMKEKLEQKSTKIVRRTCMFYPMDDV